MRFPKGSGDIRFDFTSCCSLAFLEVLPAKAMAMLEAGELQEFATKYPEFRSRFAAELRALGDVMNWLSANGDEELRRRSRN
jgi:hypothetical protein